MPRLWIGNFDFEHQLAEPGRTLSNKLRRLNAELAPCWLAVAEDGDAIWTPEPIPAEFWETMVAAGFPRITTVTDWRCHVGGYEVTPWGWTPELLAATRSVRALPPANVVRQANSRRWSFDRETEWQTGLPGAACCSSLTDVVQAISALPGRDAGWVIKAEFGMSARERILGRGALTDSAANWLRHRLQADGVVFFEPWGDCVAEAGILWEIPATGEPQLIGVAEMLPSSQGQYAGSVFAGTDQTPWPTAVEVTHRVAAELQRQGYVGPLGIDAMWYRTADGDLKLRPLQDINARWTMGRLALGWRRFFPDATWGCWTHSASCPLAPVFGGEGRGEGANARAMLSSEIDIGQRQEARDPLTLTLSPTGERGPEERSVPASPFVIVTSPDIVGGQPCRHRTALVVHPRE